MDDVIGAVQEGAELQHRVFDSTVSALKCLFTSLPGEAKDSVSVKKLLAGEVDLVCVQDILRWIIDTVAGAVALPDLKLKELWALLDIPVSQRRMSRKDLELLVGKLRSIHLAVRGRWHISNTSNVRWPRREWIEPGFLQTSTARSWTGKYWRIRQLIDPLTLPRSSVTNPPIWGSATPEDSGPGECG